MIIKIRNRIFLAITMISISIFVTMALFTGLQIFNKIITFPEIQFTLSNILLKPNIFSTIISIFILLLYAIFALFYINIHFEKTQSSEIIYFVLFLSAILLEFVRLYIPCLNLWKSTSIITIIISKIVLFSRILSPMALLYISIQNLPEHRKNVDQNLIILIIASAIIAVFVPVNSEIMTDNARLKFGFENQFFIFWIIITFVTFLSLIQTDFSENSHTKIPFVFLLLAAGYKILTSTNIFALVLAGTFLLISGTSVFLKELHKKYLWD